MPHSYCVFFFTNCGSVVTLLWVTIFRAPFSISICSLCVCITFWECLQFSNFSLLYLLWGQQLVNFDLTIIIIGAFFKQENIFKLISMLFFLEMMLLHT